MMRNIINWIIEKGTLRIGILIFILSELLLIGSRSFLSTLQLRFHAPLPVPYQVSQPSSLWIKYWIFYSIFFTLVLILMGILFVHIAFPKEKRGKNFIHLLKSTLYLSLIGLPFPFFNIARWFYGYKPVTDFEIHNAVVGIFSPLLIWLEMFRISIVFPLSLHTLMISKPMNFVFFFVFFFIYSWVVSTVYQVSIRESINRLLSALLILLVIWILLSIILPFSGGFGYGLLIFRIPLGHSPL